MISNKRQDIKQILQNTRDIMDRLGIQEKAIARHEDMLQDHTKRLAEIEARLREMAKPHGRRAYVLSSDARQVADEMDLTVHQLYKILRQAGMIIPGDEEHNTKVHRMGDQMCRVLVLRKGDG